MRKLIEIWWIEFSWKAWREWKYWRLFLGDQIFTYFFPLQISIQNFSWRVEIRTTGLECWQLNTMNQRRKLRFEMKILCYIISEESSCAGRRKTQSFWGAFFSFTNFLPFFGLFSMNASFPMLNKFLIFLSHDNHLYFTTKRASEKERQNCNWNDDDEILSTRAFCIKIIWWKSTVFSPHFLNLRWSRSFHKFSKILVTCAWMVKTTINVYIFLITK
jgi:hypothetical protein